MDWTKPLDIADQIHATGLRDGYLRQSSMERPCFHSTAVASARQKALGQRFEEVRAWIRELEDGSRANRGFGYDIEWIDIKHRQLGRNQIPDGILVPTERDALR